VIPPLWLLLQLPRSALIGASGDTLSGTHDTLAAAVGSVRDTLSSAPLPGGVATVLRFLFQVPQWIQIGGAIVGAGVAVALLVLLWRRRYGILTWLRTRSRQVQAALGIGVVLLVGVAALAGMKSWDYMQHENAFCTGCHIMERPFRRFAGGAGRHEDLKCHDCHQQSIFASTRQLVLWVAERPEKIGAHAPVPNQRCESCHQIQGGREVWQHVRRLAGHRVHFESDSTPLKELACVKCHGAEVHKFLPSVRTCEQSGCHEKQAVTLAGMARLPEINCVTCHAFTADLPGLATRDSAVRALVPGHQQCLSCHQMKGRPAGFKLNRDPHNGSCGSCHDVHAHVKAADAQGSCRNCHEDLSRSAFHNGANHRRIQTQCVTCHQPHAASVDASDCVACHNDVRKRGLFKAPLPFDTAAVLRKRVLPSPTPSFAPELDGLGHRGKGDALMEEDLPPVRASPGTPAAIAADSFPHARHRSLPCLTCHLVNRPGPGGGLVFQAPRGCDLCHHQALVAGQVRASDCARCHRTEALAAPHASDVQVQVGVRAPVTRRVAFRHEAHANVACADCHRPPEAVPPDSVRTCTACHDQHHTEQRDCVQCHTRDTNPSHSRATHVGCAECHTPARIAKLVPARAFCLSCHAKEREHLPGRECSTCHFLATPAELRPQLLKTGAR
jgi:hypothetical protein